MSCSGPSKSSGDEPRARRSSQKLPSPKTQSQSGGKKSSQSTSQKGKRKTGGSATSWGNQVPPSRSSQAAHSGKWSGLGCGVVVLALLLIIGLVGFVIAGFGNSPEKDAYRLPIPDNVPPAAAKKAPGIDIHRDGRTAEQLARWAHGQAEHTGIPYQALLGYGNAEVIAKQSRPHCGITWNTLAGLGFVETRHGTYDGQQHNATKLDDQGTTENPIYGPQLNGDGFAEVVDTDSGALDGDKEFDRAMGPLQFIPESWGRYGVDASGDGHANPQNIDDAAASAVRLLCDNGRDLRTPEGWTQAIRAYNMSDEYVRNVRDAAASYAMGQPAQLK